MAPGVAASVVQSVAVDADFAPVGLNDQVLDVGAGLLYAEASATVQMQEFISPFGEKKCDVEAGGEATAGLMSGNPDYIGKFHFSAAVSSKLFQGETDTASFPFSAHAKDGGTGTVTEGDTVWVEAEAHGTGGVGPDVTAKASASDTCWG